MDLFADNGCAQARDRGYTGKCVKCPLTECLEISLSKRSPRNEARNKEIVTAYRSGATIEQLMAKHHLSGRTMERILSDGRKKKKANHSRSREANGDAALVRRLSSELGG
jgi:hypothetical protein